MGMVVQHNITAMNAKRMLGVTTGQQSKSAEKLSSGYKINRAADDAAGLSISEKMRKQIKGLKRATNNAQDGISAVQTAEGALTEVHSMLQRMNELAVQSSNGTNDNATDRKAIQDEMDQLITEIDRVSSTTKFNEIYLLKGSEAEGKDLEVTYQEGYGISGAIAIKTDGKTDTSETNYYAAVNGTKKLTYGELKDMLEVKTKEDGTQEIAFKEGQYVYKKVANSTENSGNGQQMMSEEATSTAIDEFKIDSTKLVNASNKEIDEKDLVNYFDADGSMKEQLKFKNSSNEISDVGDEKLNSIVKRQYVDKDPVALEFSLHVGAESTNKGENSISVKIESMSAKGIGVDVLKGAGVSTQASAENAIDTIATAIQKVSDQRSALGAVQNRLEHTVANLDNIAENTTAAESRIRDTDMADEMVEYSKNNILAQAGQSMLAQANQSNQGVLSLLG